MVKFAIIMMVRTSKPTTTETLMEAIQSIRNQTYKDYDLFIVQNGFDEALKIPELQKNEYVVISMRRDLYGFELRNEVGIMADCDYVLHTNGDNILDNNALEIINNKILQSDNPPLVVFKIRDNRFGILDGYPIRIGNIDLMQGIIRWDVFANNQFTGISPIEDGLYFMRLAEKYDNIEYFDNIIGEHR